MAWRMTSKILKLDKWKQSCCLSKRFKPPNHTKQTWVLRVNLMFLALICGNLLMTSKDLLLRLLVCWLLRNSKTKTWMIKCQNFYSKLLTSKALTKLYQKFKFLPQKEFSNLGKDILCLETCLATYIVLVASLENVSIMTMTKIFCQKSILLVKNWKPLNPQKVRTLTNDSLWLNDLNSCSTSFYVSLKLYQHCLSGFTLLYVCNCKF